LFVCYLSLNKSCRQTPTFQKSYGEILISLTRCGVVDRRVGPEETRLQDLQAHCLLLLDSRFARRIRKKAVELSRPLIEFRQDALPHPLRTKDGTEATYRYIFVDTFAAAPRLKAEPALTPDMHDFVFANPDSDFNCSTMELVNLCNSHPSDMTTLIGIFPAISHRNKY
jgi:hypothetical protein